MIAWKEAAVPRGVVRVAAWLQPQEILLDVDCAGREQLLAHASDAIARRHGLQPKTIFDALWRREQAGSTALGAGFAIPHARVSGIPRPLTLFVRTRDPVPFAATDGQPVSDLLIILVPADGANDDHLQLLALVARLFSDRRFRKQLRAADGTATAARAFEKGIERVTRTA